MDVQLCPITQENYHAAMQLQVAPEQQTFTPSNVHVLAALPFQPGRMALGIVDQHQHVLVGFLVYGLDAATGRWWIHHVMVDAPQQRHGYGRSALEHLIAQVAQQVRVTHLYARYHLTNEAAKTLGARVGFQATAEVQDGHMVVMLPLPAPLLSPPQITLRDITLANARACIQLQVLPHQARFVASNAESLIQSKFEPHWVTKAIYNEEEMVGFVMYGYDAAFGWGVLRLMVDAAYQGRGYGRVAMHLVLAEIHAAGGTSVGVSYEADNGVARRFYHSLGFVETGDEPFGEPFAVLTLPMPGV